MSYCIRAPQCFGRKARISISKSRGSEIERIDSIPSSIFSANFVPRSKSPVRLAVIARVELEIISRCADRCDRNAHEKAGQGRSAELGEGQRGLGQTFWADGEKRQTNSDAGEKDRISENSYPEEIHQNRRMPEPCRRKIVIAPTFGCRVREGGAMGRRLSTIHSCQRWPSQLRRRISWRAHSRSVSIVNDNAYAWNRCEIVGVPGKRR